MTIHVQPVLVVKTAGEIALKTHFVRRYFVNKLVAGMKSVCRAKRLSGNRFVKGNGRVFVFVQKENSEKKLERLGVLFSRLFGVHEVALGFSFEFDSLNEIAGVSARVSGPWFKGLKTFAVRPRRVGNHSFSSHGVAVAVGSAVIALNKKLKVDLANPEMELFVEVRARNATVFSNPIKGPGGLPLGVQGNVALLVRGKKEDALAGWLMMKRGCNVFPVLGPRVTVARAKKVLKVLHAWNLFRSFRFTPLKELDFLVKNPSIGIQALATGDARVSVQGLKDFLSFDSGIPIPVFRPLLFYSGNDLHLLGLRAAGVRGKSF
ncbi:MAG: hypothetical protein HY393_02165 [Candidatus Diapherotrites archaeon]|nr:hypothetical protein [Candidatus Diapherotrites archaeon]